MIQIGDDKFNIDRSYYVHMLDDATEDEKYKFVRYDSSNISRIDNPSDDIQVMAVVHNGLLIQLIEHPSKAVQIIAVNTNPLAIQYIDDQHYEACKVAVEKHSLTIQYVKDQTPDLQLKSVEDDIRNFQYIKNPTSDVCIYVINNMKYNFGHYSIGDSEPILANSELHTPFNVFLHLPDDIPVEVQYSIIKNNPDDIRHIKNPPEEICKAALYHKPSCIMYMEKADFIKIV